VERGTTGTVKGWRYEIDRGVCSLCGEVDSVLSSTSDIDPCEVGICEHCTMVAGMAWRGVAGEVPPGLPDEDVRRVSSASVLVARRSRVPDPSGDAPPVPGPRDMPTAYEFLMVAAPGGRALPTSPVPPGATVREGALRALESVGLHSWPALLETLHVGYTPRGRLSAVVLARGYASRDAAAGAAGTWLPWPVSAHAGRMAGFYDFMEATWPLRLYRLCVPGDRLPSEVSVSMREVARRYVELRTVVGAGGDVDSSMLAAYRSAMTADEVAVAEVVARFEEEGRRKPPKCLPAIPPGEGGESGGERGSGAVDPGIPAGDDSGGDSGGEDPGGEGDAGEGLDDPPPEPGFARGFRRG
jgi:hypothetical protein